MGDSGGGGVTASLAIYARDQGQLAIAKQILIYPMLDDRNTSADPFLAPFATWSYDNNATGWGALLGEGAGGANVSPYAAGARLEDKSVPADGSGQCGLKILSCASAIFRTCS
jgi:acetyl esterase/lipase